MPSSQWRRYDKMCRFPAGLLVVGDAICSFNPVYGQGMTAAALDAVVVRDCLRRGQRDLARRFFRAAARPIGVAWQFAVGADLAMPEVEGTRTLSIRLTNRYVDRLLTAAESDAELVERFLRVQNFIDPPTRLLASPFAAVPRGDRQPAPPARRSRSLGKRSGSVTNRQSGTADCRRVPGVEDSWAISEAAPGTRRMQVISVSPPGSMTLQMVTKKALFRPGTDRFDKLARSCCHCVLMPLR